MRIASATAVFLAITSAGWSAQADAITEDHACLGRWVGRGKNTGFPTEWTIDLTLTNAASGGRCGTIEYTNPLCGGTLEACTAVDGEIRTRERYSHDEGHCAAPGRVILRCDGDRMQFRWIGWETTNSVLQRAANGAPAPAVPATPTNGATPIAVPTSSSPSPSPPSPSPPSSPTPKATRGCGSGCAVGAGRPTPAGSLFLVGLAIVLACARRAARLTVPREETASRVTRSGAQGRHGCAST